MTVICVASLLQGSYLAPTYLMEGQIFSYDSTDDDEDEFDDLPLVVSKKRGVGRSWSFIKNHDNLELGMKSMSEYNHPTVTRLKGRNNRARTASYYFYCAMKSCGCTKEWRIVTSYDSLIVREEESTGDHVFHDKLVRNGGRGMSFDQVKLVDQAFEMGIKKPKAVLDFIKKDALLHPDTGEFDSLCMNNCTINHL